MITLEKPANEAERLQSLRKYQILDTPPDGNFDRITALASFIFKVPIAIISMVDTDRIWFKSHYGLNVKQIGRDPGLCASAILSKELYVIENAKEDPRSLANPLVAGEFGLRFYAATPLQTEENHNLGTLCIIDKHPRTFTADERDILKMLGDIVMDEMNMRLSVRETAMNIRDMAADITENLKSAVTNIEQGTESDVVSYLKATGFYMQNIQNQLNHV
ncbi:MAG TPA: GAF domain-containing protein [Chryseosolibacter sp.]